MKPNIRRQLANRKRRIQRRLDKAKLGDCSKPMFTANNIHYEIGDRSEAIAAAVAELRRGDILVIAGKGHETGQLVGGTVLPFDDVLVARDAIIVAGGG